MMEHRSEPLGRSFAAFCAGFAVTLGAAVHLYNVDTTGASPLQTNPYADLAHAIIMQPPPVPGTHHIYGSNFTFEVDDARNAAGSESIVSQFYNPALPANELELSHGWVANSQYQDPDHPVGQPAKGRLFCWAKAPGKQGLFIHDINMQPKQAPGPRSWDWGANSEAVIRLARDECSSCTDGHGDEPILCEFTVQWRVPGDRSYLYRHSVLPPSALPYGLQPRITAVVFGAGSTDPRNQIVGRAMVVMDVNLDCYSWVCSWVRQTYCFEAENLPVIGRAAVYGPGGPGWRSQRCARTFCVGNAPGSPCAVPTPTATSPPTLTPSATPRCDHCPWPASLNSFCFTERWGPEKDVLSGTPITWFVDQDSFELAGAGTPTPGTPTPNPTLWIERNSTPEAWATAMAAAAAEWNTLATPDILVEATSSVNADIVVEGVTDDAWEAWRKGDWLTHAVTDLYGDSAAPQSAGSADGFDVIVTNCCAGDPNPKQFGAVQQRRTVIKVHLAHARPAVTNTHSVIFDPGGTWSGRSPWRFPMSWLLAHEIGHSLLGARHFGPCPSPPDWPVLCSPDLNASFPRPGTVSIDIASSSFADALLCQLRWPRNWRTPSPGPTAGPYSGTPVGTGVSATRTATATRTICPVSEGPGMPSPTPPPTSTPCPTGTP
jgi:hypothetical protein